MPATASGIFLGFDPGRDKCGLALVSGDRHPLRHEVVPAEHAIATLQDWLQAEPPQCLVMGDGTTTKQWQIELEQAFPNLAIALVDERNSTLEARDRYWQLYPPQGLQRLVPLGMRVPPRPVDDIVAILLVERYLQASS
ncbi:MAG: pre-16S rRNA-processing nuclease YqgF [Cyanobacteria bacterium J06641_5]